MITIYKDFPALCFECHTVKKIQYKSGSFSEYINEIIQGGKSQVALTHLSSMSKSSEWKVVIFKVSLMSLSHL